MNLLATLKEINKQSELTNNTYLKVVCKDGEFILGYYLGYVSAYDNTPEIAQIDLLSDDGTYTSVIETDIASVEALNLVQSFNK